MSARPALFLDRDGVLNEVVVDLATGIGQSPLHPDDVKLIPGVASSLRALSALPIALVCVTNQPAAAKGTASLEALAATHRRVLELLAAQGVPIHSRVCYHHPEALVPALAGPCRCRKPEPGMLLAASTELAVDIARSWMIGDSTVDIEAGRRAGCRTVLIEYGPTAHRRNSSCQPDAQAPDLATAIEWLLKEEGGWRGGALSSG